MTPEQQKEELSRAYVTAVAAACGFVVGAWSQDQGGIDVSVSADGSLGGGVLENPQLDIQLKCTSKQDHLREDHVWWRLERRHYDRLRGRRANTQLLVVLLLPSEPEDWVRHSVEALVLRRCAYWVKMTGMSPMEGESKTIHLPLEQVFSPEQLRSLMEKLSREEPI